MRCLRATAFWIVAGTFLICGLLSSVPAVPRTLQTELPQNLDGKATDPFKMADGRVIVLLFVRTDCPISNRYAPAIQKLSEEFHGRANF
jgi:thiol-disulfide isomerase/thioredoxin